MRMIYLAVVFALSWSAALAEDWVPQRSAIVSHDLDYLGTDIQAIFDTTLPACQAACLDNGLCRAFTFNQRSDACFLKAEVLQTAPPVPNGHIRTNARPAQRQRPQPPSAPWH